jgi:beta-glucosidase-like glycosyl hydrolase
MIKKRLRVYAVLLFSALLVQAQDEPLRPANWDRLTVAQKADWLVSQMTLEEKVEQINVGTFAQKKEPTRGSCSQIWNTRLGIMPIRATDGPRGPRPNGDRPANRTTSGREGPVSPTGLCLASSWNPQLQEQMGRQWGLLTKEYGLNALYGPGINIIKDPRAGRNTDYAGEDPYLTGSYGAAMTKGIQSAGVAAVAKHLIANNWESGRQSHNVEVPLRPLRELYMPGFRMAVEEGGSLGLMTCYNALNGVWGSADRWLLTDVVRKEWGFKGFFVSDWGAQFGSAAQAIHAGQNLELPGNTKWGLPQIQAALDANEITMADLDERVAELLRIKLDLIDYQADDELSGYDLDAFKAAAREIGGESLVLLKNDRSLLPLKKTQSVALIGPFAHDAETMIGNAGSSQVPPSYCVTVKDALEARGIKVNYDAGGLDGFTYNGARVEKKWPCTIEYFNGENLDGPVVLRETASELTLNGIKAAAPLTSVPGDGPDRGRYSGGQRQIDLGMTPGGAAWTLGLSLWLEDQLPDASKSMLVLWAHNVGRIEMTSKKLTVRMEGKKAQSVDLDWQDMDKQWRDVLFVNQGGALRVYRGEQLIAEVADFGAPRPMKIIIADRGAGLPLHLDAVRTWDRALSPDRAAAVEPLWNCDLESVVVADNGGVPGILDTRDMSIRAQGVFAAKRPGKVGFQVETMSGVRIFIDGQLVYDLNDEQKAKGRKNVFYQVFADTRPHDLVVEFRSKHNYGESSFLRLSMVQPPVSSPFGKAVAAAEASDVAVVCVGVPSTQQAENMDRPRIELPSWQDELIAAVVKANPNTVVALFTEGGVDVRPWIETVPAALVAFHPGSEGGNIIGDILYGDVNPSGKLTLTWPKANEDLPTTGPNPHYADTVNEFGYRYFDAKGIEPMFPFGYGLSYTTFAYDELNVQKSGDVLYPLTATVTVRNAGKIAGKEVVQIYASDCESSVEQPVKELAGFLKVDLKPGESKTVEIPLHWTAFQFFDTVSNHWKLEPGDFKISAGGSSDQLPLQISINL